MNPRPDSQLLLDFAERRSDAAFAELVRRHLNLVHAAALRITRDPDLAKDVSQSVFIALANQAGKLAGHAILAGWLHRTTRNIAAQSIRTETRRRARERMAELMPEPSDPDTDWQPIAPQLDAALSDLAAADRDAILLRYFENKSASEMADLLGISPDAAQKRVNRAVERLRAGFGRRGLPVGAAGLAGAISANAVPIAPAGMAAAISSAISSTVSSSTAALATTARILAMTTFQKCLIAAGIVLLSGVGFFEFNRAGNPSEERARDHREAMGLTKRRSSTAENTRRPQTAKAPIDRQKELARLKTKWLELKPLGNAGVDNRVILVKESARLLLCSQEAVELLKFLKENEMTSEAVVLEHEIALLFDSPHAAEARQLLVELPETAEISDERSYKEGAEPYRDKWSNAAGKTCPDDEFESFRTALNCKSCALEALFGRNESLMASDPHAAFASSLEAFKSGTPAISGRYGVTRLFEGELPPGIDFKKLEKQQPPDGPRDEWHGHPGDENAFTEIRRKLFWNWAKIDPAAAANHVLANPDRLAPELMEDIVGGYSYKDPNGVIAWVATFPEGPHFDAAARSAAVYARGTPAIDELIKRIQDPKMREEAEKRAQVPLANPDTR